MHLEKQEQEAKMKILIQEKVEPVDIREIDEESMIWTLSHSSMVQEDDDSEDIL